MKKLLLHLAVFITLVSLTQPSAHAQNCQPLYGGGVTSQQVCDGKVSTAGTTGTTQPTVTTLPKTTPQMKVTPTPVRLNNGSTSKGGIPVLSPTPAQKTPSTGPELLGLLALLPAGAFGYYLRKKAQMQLTRLFVDSDRRMKL